MCCSVEHMGSPSTACTLFKSWRIKYLSQNRIIEKVFNCSMLQIFTRYYPLPDIPHSIWEETHYYIWAEYAYVLEPQTF